MPQNSPSKAASGTSQDTKTLVTVLLLIFIWPVGLIVMWVWSGWKAWIKILITVLSFLVILPIVAMLATVVLVAVNPSELLKKAKDATRISDLTNINQSIKLAIEADPNFKLCPDTTPCTYVSTDSDWLPLKLDLSLSPKDPINTGEFIYTYCSDGKDWELNGIIESSGNKSKQAADGGDDPTIWESGSNKTLCRVSN